MASLHRRSAPRDLLSAPDGLSSRRGASQGSRARTPKFAPLPPGHHRTNSAVPIDGRMGPDGHINWRSYPSGTGPVAPYPPNGMLPAVAQWMCCTPVRQPLCFPVVGRGATASSERVLNNRYHQLLLQNRARMAYGPGFYCGPVMHHLWDANQIPSLVHGMTPFESPGTIMSNEPWPYAASESQRVSQPEPAPRQPQPRTLTPGEWSSMQKTAEPDEFRPPSIDYDEYDFDGYEAEGQPVEGSSAGIRERVREEQKEKQALPQARLHPDTPPELAMFLQTFADDDDPRNSAHRKEMFARFDSSECPPAPQEARVASITTQSTQIKLIDCVPCYRSQMAMAIFPLQSVARG